MVLSVHVHATWHSLDSFKPSKSKANGFPREWNSPFEQKNALYFIIVAGAN